MMHADRTETVGVSGLVTFGEEFTGRQFFGKGSKPKGRFVKAAFRENGRKVEVEFEAPSPFGPTSFQDFPTNATVRVEKATS